MTPTLFDAFSASAVISDCGAYRYSLTRRWGDCQLCGFCMLNPSTADASIDDPTIRRCMGFARGWGYDGIVVKNLYALRATDPRELYKHSDPIGQSNEQHLLYFAKECPLIVCAWGTHGSWNQRGKAVTKLLLDAGANLVCLGTTQEGHPKHPLYLAANAERVEYGVVA